MRSVAGIFCAVLLSAAMTQANQLISTSGTMTLTVPTNSKTDTSVQSTFNISDSIADATATANGQMTSIATSEGTFFALTGNASGETTIFFTDSQIGSAPLQFGGNFTNTGGTLSIAETLYRIDGGTPTQIGSVDFTAGVQSQIISQFVPNNIGAPQTYEVDFQVSHTGSGTGSIASGIMVVPLPTTLCGGLALVCTVCALESRKRRLNSRSAPRS